MNTKSLRAVMYAALDATVFAGPDALPALNTAYRAAFQTYRTVLNTTPALALCACCDEPTSANELAPVASDWLYAQAVQQCSFERDDDVCETCRAHFQAEFGYEPDEVYHVFDRGRDKRD